MMQRHPRTIAATVVMTVLTLGVGVAAGGIASAAQPTSTKAKASVVVGDNYFKPMDLEVAKGTKVTWTNKGKILHNVTAVKGKYGTKSLSPGSKYSYTFKKPGTYTYYCSFHGSPTAGQHGSVIVSAASTTATSTTTVPAG